METGVLSKEPPKRPTMSTPPPDMSTPSTMPPTKMKDITVSNLVETQLGDGPVCVTKFFNKIERIAKFCNWTGADKVPVAVLKLLGADVVFLNSNDEAKRDDIIFGRL